MIFKEHQLKGIKAGTISLAFRRWEKPNVKIGSTQKTAVGVIKILAVEPVKEDAITMNEVVKAGYDTITNLFKDLSKGTGTIYKVKVKYDSEDPRIALREKTDITEDELANLLAKISRLDKTRGPWVLKVLRLIHKFPERRAGDLAEMMQMDKLDFKLNVRKLKNLGLTVSHEIGYSISPLGDIVIDKLR